MDRTLSHWKEIPFNAAVLLCRAWGHTRKHWRQGSRVAPDLKAQPVHGFFGFWFFKPFTWKVLRADQVNQIWFATPTVSQCFQKLEVHWSNVWRTVILYGTHHLRFKCLKVSWIWRHQILSGQSVLSTDKIQEVMFLKFWCWFFLDRKLPVLPHRYICSMSIEYITLLGFKT